VSKITWINNDNTGKQKIWFILAKNIGFRRVSYTAEVSRLNFQTKEILKNGRKFRDTVPFSK
jgi:hypothetical protein